MWKTVAFEVGKYLGVGIVVGASIEFAKWGISKITKNSVKQQVSDGIVDGFTRTRAGAANPANAA